MTLPRITRLATAISAAILASTATHAQQLVLEEVVVTAQKRVESLQDVPIAVSAVSGEKINEIGITGLEELTLSVPNVNINSGRATPHLFIRGVGSGTTAGAAVRTQRNFVGCESEAAYIEAATARIAAEREALATTEEQRIRVVVPATRGGDTAAPADARRRAVREGAKADEIAELVLAECGFTNISRHKKLRCGVEIDLVATAADGSTWHFDVAGAHTSERAGLRRTDALWRALGKAGVRAHDESKIEFVPFVLLTTALPSQGVGLRALRTALEGELIKDAIPMLDEIGQARLREYGVRGLDHGPLDVLAADEPDALF